MAIRLQEVHPSLIHFPITMLPLAVGADTIGRFTGNRKFNWLGKWGMAAAAITGAVAGVAGLIAQEEVNVSGKSMDMLITHRTLNLVAVAGAGAMAVWRAKEKQASVGYLLGGVAACATVFYSAYLGGMLVYHHGVGVGPAQGLWQGGGPELTLDNTGRVTSRATRDLGMGLTHLAKETAQGKIVPSIVGGGSAEETGAAGSAGA
jgi:uncharacterized membrane protein